MRHLLWGRGVILCLLFMGSSVVRSLAQSTSLIVRTVTIERLPVLAVPLGSPYATLFALANKMNGFTRESIIQQELLFVEGEYLDQELFDETARNLRTNKNFGNIALLADTVAGDSVDITVCIREKWTKLVEFSFEQDGGIRQLYMAGRNNNFLGKGQRLGAQLMYQDHQRMPWEYATSYITESLFNTHWRGMVQHVGSEERSRSEGALQYPFYAAKTTWSGGGTVAQNTLNDCWYTEGVCTREKKYKNRYGTLWGIGRTTGIQRRYMGVAYTHKRTLGEDIPALSNKDYDALNVAVSLVDKRYHKGYFYDNFGRVEDVTTGYVVSGGYGYNVSAQGDSSYRSAYAARIIGALMPGNHVYLSAAFSGGMLVGGVPSYEYWTKSVARVAVRLPHKHTLVVRGKLFLRQNASPDRSYIYLDSPRGLRGYPVYGISAPSRGVCSFEYRSFSSLKVWFFKVGGAAFYDGGIVFGIPENNEDIRWHSSYGVGVRIENPKQRGSGILRIEIAYNGDTGKFSELMITTGNLFSAFEKITALHPVAVNNME